MNKEMFYNEFEFYSCNVKYVDYTEGGEIKELKYGDIIEIGIRPNSKEIVTFQSYSNNMLGLELDEDYFEVKCDDIFNIRKIHQ